MFMNDTGLFITLAFRDKDVPENIIFQKLLNGKHNYEIDFLLSRGSKICSVEVKSSGYKSHASLDAFSKKFQDRISHRYLLYTKDIRQDADTQMMPVFLAMFL